ncbi:DUF998 domain-containing protein [Amycolatopsis nigrescens]|uniref:DUF998 domain-containing protein n=1 Tax=Amycolatopsis nigrescens TaxID=381445 RepID=UPI0003A210CA|nr:DUF998 domain-containing protein [Amycolatopsis nigrescens]
MGYGDTTKQATGSSTVAARTRPWLVTSVAAIGWSTFTIVLLHTVSSHDPVRDTLSSYAFTDRGSGMLAASVLALAIASVTLLGALIASGVPVSRTTGTLFGTWSLGLATAAVFPASFEDNPHPVSGEIHQYACLVAFLSVPALGKSLLDRMRDAPALERHRAMLTKLTLLSAGGLLLFGISYALEAFPGVPVVSELAGLMPVGLSQRIALTADVILLGWLMLLAARASATNSAPAEREVSEHARS